MPLNSLQPYTKRPRRVGFFLCVQNWGNFSPDNFLERRLIMKGRKPIPTSLKKLKGTLQKCRSNKNEPRPEVCEPEIPGWICDQAGEVWRELSPQLYKAGVLTKLDALALGLLCQHHVLYMWSKGIVEKESLLIETIDSNGNRVKRANPALKIMMQSADQLTALLREFGLTPSSRTRVSVLEKKDEKINPFHELLLFKRDQARE